MGGYVKPSPLDPLHKYVHEGFWQNQNEPAYRSIVWTLRDSYAFILLAVFTLLLTLAQRQSWGLLRQILTRCKKPVRLRDDACSDPLQHLSQLEAIRETAFLLRTGIRNLRSRNRGVLILDTPVMSPYFGVLSLMNILIFISAGVAVPWLLSESWIDAPIVRSKLTEECLNPNFDAYAEMSYAIYELPIVNAIFRQCLAEVGQNCEDQYHIKTPIIEQARVDACPFQEELCIEGLKSLELTHRNFTPFEAGINLKSRFSLNRRLTCAPIQLESMMVLSKDNKKYITLQDTSHGTSGLNANYTMELETWNGPNRYSNQSSGLKMKLLGGTSDITLLPKIHTGLEMTSNTSLQAKLSRSFQREDGRPFVLIWRGGTTQYSTAVDDPLFSAHQKLTGSKVPSYFSDYEATGLGCVEQLQICIPELGRCSQWGQQWQGLEFLLEELVKVTQNSASSFENILVETFFQVIVARDMYGFFAPFWHLGYESFLAKIELPFSIQLQGDTIIDHKNEAWIYQAENWFRKSYLHGIFKMRSGARWSLTNIAYKFNLLSLPPRRRNPFSYCDRVLFRDSEYTNINFIGLCITSILLGSLCLANRFMRLIRPASAKVKTITANLLDLLRRAQVQYGWMLILVREKVITFLAYNPARRGGGGGGGGRSAFFPSVFPRITSTVNERISHWRRSTGPTSNTESGTYGLDDLRADVSPSNQNNLSRFEEIDNVI